MQQIPESQSQSEDSSSMAYRYRSWAERNGFSNWVLAIGWIIAAFFLFQITAAVVALVLIGINGGLSADPSQPMAMMTENLDLLFIGNSTGQILFLGLATWFWSRLHTSAENRPAFMRFNFDSHTLGNMLIAGLLIIFIQPLVWFLAWLNAFLPVPEFFSNMQSSQMQMIENFLKGDHILWLTLFHVALVPAVCEEVLYRSYVLRSFERSWSIWPAIIVSGLFFGMYHLQLSNLLPLASIGMVLAYITWVTRSVFPAMAAHFVNNAGSVLLGKFYPEFAFAEMSPESKPPVWAVIISLAISANIVYWMYQQHINKSARGGEYV